MADSIPDEILAEILSPALRVTEEAFSVTPEDSPFLLLSESSSAFLLVSTSWLRVATPLLYNTVILRSKGQAQALAVVLSANPALGKYIRKLRLEGGYAISMLKILKASPNISDIFLCIDIQAPDNPCGLCRGLQLIEPVRVIIYGGGGSRHPYLFPEGHKLVEKLRTCVPTWKRLSVVELNYRILPMWWPWGGMSNIAQILSTAPNLTTLVVSNQQCLLRVTREISGNPSLQRIRVKLFDSLDPQARETYLDAVKKDERLSKLFDLPDIWSSDNTPPFVYPSRLANDPVTRHRY
ncbi:hypothetical protein C8R45DRAFT_1021457 [Mycena sanguinolenta]|nr:hypothetical protein C8R45DRAFT_1021457 [Mycena sanguinolenta]